MRVKGTAHINRRTINSWVSRIFRAYLRRSLLGGTTTRVPLPSSWIEWGSRKSDIFF